MREFHDFANGRDEFIPSILSDHLRRGRLQHHNTITAYLDEDILIARDRSGGRTRAGILR